MVSLRMPGAFLLPLRVHKSSRLRAKIARARSFNPRLREEIVLVVDRSALVLADDQLTSSVRGRRGGASVLIIPPELDLVRTQIDIDVSQFGHRLSTVINQIVARSWSDSGNYPRP